MAVGAFLSHIGENGLGVALDTRHSLVHAAEWIAGLIMIEFGNTADGLPCAEGVAVLARDVEVSMRAARTNVACLLCRSRCGQDDQKNNLN